MRDLDIDMFYNKDTKIYSCIRCQYRGTEEDVLAKNEMVRFRYGAMHKRFENVVLKKKDRGGPAPPFLISGYNFQGV